MKSCIIFFFLLLLIIVSSEPIIILSGRSGTGKSYIATAMGCASKQCSDSQSCTKNSFICPNGKIIDTIGYDDDGTYVVNHNGTKITLSGFTYPLYNLFEMIEQKKFQRPNFSLFMMLTT